MDTPTKIKLTNRRKYAKNKIGLKGARSFSSMSRMNFAMRGANVDCFPHIVARHGNKLVPIFQEIGLFQYDIELIKRQRFLVA